MDTGEQVCATCGATAATGNIFCKMCGATLRPAVPLVLLSTHEGSRLPKTVSAKAIFFIFALCAVSDFILGYVHERSIPAGVISVFGGLFGTAFYVLILKWLVEHHTNPNDSSHS
jgi:hypothetical protein